MKNKIIIGLVLLIFLSGCVNEYQSTIPNDFCQNLAKDQFGYKEPLCFKFTDKDCVCANINETVNFGWQDGSYYKPYWEVER